MCTLKYVNILVFDFLQEEEGQGGGIYVHARPHSESSLLCISQILDCCYLLSGYFHFLF